MGLVTLRRSVERDRRELCKPFWAWTTPKAALVRLTPNTPPSSSLPTYPSPREKLCASKGNGQNSILTGIRRALAIYIDTRPHRQHRFAT